MARDEDSEYNSEEDGDFNEDNVISNSSSDESDVPKTKKVKSKRLDEGDLAIISVAGDKSQAERGDLILTRAQKRRKYTLRR